jgi:dTDP-glucose 4,6-dehydratase
VAGIEGETFNLGTGVEVSIAELAQTIVSLVGKRVEIKLDESRLRPEKSEVQRLLSDNSLARQRLGWSPEIDLENGLRDTIAWISEHLDLYTPDKYQI